MVLDPDAGLVDPVLTYVERVLGFEIVAGPLVRAACQRHLRDLKNPLLVWDLAGARKAIEFFPDVLTFTDGDKAGQPFVLSLWQKFIVGSIFGWKTLAGIRRFRTAYIEIGKGNGKSPMAAGVGLYLLTADGEAGAEVYSAATKLEQAKILWTDAKRMVENSEILYGDADFVNIKTNLIEVPQTNSIFRPISSEKKGLDGLRVHGALIDELHEHADSVVTDKLRAGTKGRKQALLFEITNSGYDRKTVCYQHHEFSTRVLNKLEFNETWFAYVCALDEGDDWEKDVSCWYKANPNLDVSIRKEYLQELVNEARQMPAKRSMLERLNFCRWVGASNPWISQVAWMACELPEEDWQAAWEQMEPDTELYIGLDLSARKDLTALSLTWKTPWGLLNDVIYFTPAQGLQDRANMDKAPYVSWVERGFLRTTPGSMVDYSFVAMEIKQLAVKYNLVGVAFDPWRIGLIEKELKLLGEDEIVLVPHAQGFTGGAAKGSIWMPKSIESFEEVILAGRFKYRANAVTLFCASNAITVMDPAGNKKFEKAKATGRMDGTVAQAMSVGFAEHGIPDPENDGPSIYVQRGMMMV